MQRHGEHPGEDSQLDCTHMPKSKGLQYLLVWVDTSTKWVEPFPGGTEKAQEVESLVSDIVPRFRLPKSLQSDGGLSFKATVTQCL